MLKVSDLDLTKQIDWSKAVPVHRCRLYDVISADDYDEWEGVEYKLYMISEGRASLWMDVTVLRDTTGESDSLHVISYDGHTSPSYMVWESLVWRCQNISDMCPDIVVGLVEPHLDVVHSRDCIVLAHRLS